MKNRIATAIGVLGLLLTTGCATMNKTPADSQAAAQPSDSTMQGEVLTGAFTVRVVDLKQRLITLKDKQGKVSTFRVSNDVSNLPQIKAGNSVAVKYYEAEALQINKDTTGGVSPVQKPASGARNTVEILANILAIDPKTRKITFQGPERTLVVKAPADKDLNRLDVGDQVKLVYIEELAVAVEPLRAKMAKRGPSPKSKTK